MKRSKTPPDDLDEAIDELARRLKREGPYRDLKADLRLLIAELAGKRKYQAFRKQVKDGQKSIDIRKSSHHI